MFHPLEEVGRTPEQLQRYGEVLASLKRLEKETRDSDDPVVFHGTSLLRGRQIENAGFKNSHVQQGPEDHPHNTGSSGGVYWGTVNIAALFAEEGAAYWADDLPVFLMTTISSISKVASLYPDWHALLEASLFAAPYDDRHEPIELDDGLDWRQSLKGCGAFVSIGGTRIPGLQLINPFAGLPVHPHWQRDRDHRLTRNDYSLPQPFPGLIEDTALSSPPTMTIEDAEHMQQESEDRALLSVHAQNTGY